MPGWSRTSRPGGCRVRAGDTASISGPQKSIKRTYTQRHGHGAGDSLANEGQRNGDAEELGEHVDVNEERVLKEGALA